MVIIKECILVVIGIHIISHIIIFTIYQTLVLIFTAFIHIFSIFLQIVLLFFAYIHVRQYGTLTSFILVYFLFFLHFLMILAIFFII